MKNRTLEGVDELYDGSADKWARTAPLLLSDYTARPQVLELCEPIAGTHILDLGCGEGYCARQLAERGAREVTGLDISNEMIERGRAQEGREPRGIRYLHGHATDLSRFEPGSFDLVVAVFLFNYLTIEEMRVCMSEILRVLAPQGRFVFSVPHPLFPYLRPAEPPFYFEVDARGYFGSRDCHFSGRIWKRDRTSVEVRLRHKTFEDYFDALNAAGFKTLPNLKELHVSEGMLELDREFFSPLIETPLHVAVEVAA